MSPLDIFFSAPPISRTLAATIFIFSLLVYIDILPYDLCTLSLRSLILLPPELWRVFTSLLITGPHAAILFDTYFLYVYGAKLESASPRFTQRAEFATYICFNCLIIMLINLFITSGHVLANALGLSFITTSTHDSWDQPMTLFIIKMPAQYLPYAILLLILILASPQAAMIQATGLVAAHFYNLSTGLYPNFGIKRNLITTPGWVTRMFGTQDVVPRPHGTVYLPGSKAAWGLDLSWQRFGPGRRLGGEGPSAERRRPRGCVLAAMVMGGFIVVCGFLVFFVLQHGGPDHWFASVDLRKLAHGMSRPGDETAISKTDE